jgi:hypothetical protein
VNVKTLTLILWVVVLGILAAAPSIELAWGSAQVSIFSDSGYIDSNGYFHVVGEVRNVGDVSVDYAKVTGTFYDTSNVVVATSFTYTELDVIPSGRKSPFDLILTDKTQAAKVYHYELSGTFTPTYPLPVGLNILSNSSYTDGTGLMHVVGEIQNIGSTRATYIKIVTTYYDGTGTVVAAGFASSVPSDLDPAQKGSFDVLLSSDRVPFVSSYEITAESSQYSLVPEFGSYVVPFLFMLATVLTTIILKKRIARASSYKA